MAIAITLREFLDNSGLHYNVIPHAYTTNSMSTAAAAHVPGDQLIKSVILEDENGFVMAIVPSTHYIELDLITKQLHRHLGLATENELEDIFIDCDLGAIPPIGGAYGLDVIMDDCIIDCPDVYFETGDHQNLVHMKGEDFHYLLQDAKCNRISYHM